MPRGGTELERLTALLEGALADTDVVVRSPDYLMGRRSGSRREVDVSLRGMVGSVPVFVILECRDRSRTEDVSWIEQLATKRRDVGADKAVAVSASAFSGGAKALAETEGIELRILREVEVSDVFAWLGIRELEVEIQRVGLGNLHLDVLETPDEVVEWLSSQPLSDHDQQIFLDRRSGEPVSTWEVVKRETAGAPPHKVRLPANGRPVVQRLRIQFAGDDLRYQVITPWGPVDIHTLEVDVRVSSERRRIAIGRLSQYVSERGSLVESSEFHLKVDGDKWVFSLHRLVELDRLAASLRAETE